MRARVKTWVHCLVAGFAALSHGDGPSSWGGKRKSDILGLPSRLARLPRVLLVLGSGWRFKMQAGRECKCAPEAVGMFCNA